MSFLARTGFNVVFPVVWNKGMTVYPSQVMQQTFGIEKNPEFAGRNPLAEVIDEARRVGLKVIPWFEYGFASSYNLNGGLLLAKKPEWAARDSEGKLLKKNGFEWLNSLALEVQEFMLNLILEVVKNYEIDGIQGDDRLPALPSEGGYDRGTVERYRQHFGEDPPTNCKNDQWLRWRADILTDFLARLRKEVKAVNPNLLISLSPSVYDWGYKEYLQDSPTWIKRGLVDIIHPQAYRRDIPAYKDIMNRQIRDLLADVSLTKLAPGILIKSGSYCISPEDLLQTIEHNRANGIFGEVFFFYEGLRDNNDAIAQVLRQNPYAKSAEFPSLSELNKGIVSKKKSSSFGDELLRFWRNVFQR
jgi:uncharacterized lipoprotein YddW (UPF0748 family)